MIVDESRLDAKETMLKEIETMNAFGNRATGTKGHQQFIAWLKSQLLQMGLEVHSDVYAFDRWEETRSAFYINQEEIPISSAYPYSGETDAKGVTEELIYVKRSQYKKARGKIAVVKINATNHLPLGLIMNKRSAFPDNTQIAVDDGELVLTSVLKNPHLKKAKECGVKAVVLVWSGVSDAKVENQYLPFTDEYIGIPAIWVNETEGKKVIDAAKKGEWGTVILEAGKQKNATTESFYVTMEGKSKEETILINTHTDGINVVEENGAIGMLSMIRYLQEYQPQRTMVFAFVTGHFRLPVFKGTSQATSTWLMQHPALWDGKNGNRRAVAGITVEHLGSMEWKQNKDGKYEATGNIQTEYTYVGNKQMETLWNRAMEGRTLTRTVLLRGHNKFEFGESQPLFEVGVPVVGLIQMPDYLMTKSKDGEMDKFNVELMREQIKSLLAAIVLVDGTSSEELGRADGYSFGLGKVRSTT
jgi:hypothetical protein